jgi:AcrR family transcriptional regulator
MSPRHEEQLTEGTSARRVRADARRNEDAVLEAAKVVFARLGVDAPVRDIALQAGVGVGTLYRRFPKRADLVAAVFRREVDACASEAGELAAERTPIDALGEWLIRYTRFIATKRGLASALHSGDPAFETLPSYFRSRFEPALEMLLDAAREAGRSESAARPTICFVPSGIWPWRPATTARPISSAWSACSSMGCGTVPGSLFSIHERLGHCGYRRSTTLPKADIT